MMENFSRETLNPREFLNFNSKEVEKWFTGVLTYYVHHRLQKTLRHMYDGACTYNTVAKEIAHSVINDARVYKEESINGRSVPQNIMEMFSFLSPFPTPVLIDVLLKTDFATVAGKVAEFLGDRFHTEEESE